MKILIDIDTGNDAFQEPNLNYMLWVILSYWVDRIIDQGATDSRLPMDVNGNSCGRVTVFETDADFDKALTGWGAAI